MPSERNENLSKHLYHTMPTCSSVALTDQPLNENLLRFIHIILFVMESHLPTSKTYFLLEVYY